MACKKTSCAKN